MYREWNNVKFSSLPHSDNPPYLYHRELRKPLTYKDNTFDAIYCNHVFEHLTPEDGTKLANELYRILKPNGICRIVVPDLESMAREYIHNLEEVLSKPNTENIVRYEWGVADLIDQMVRVKSGGLMKEKLIAGDINWEQIKRRNGDVFDVFKLNQDKLQNRGIKFRIKKYFPKSVSDTPRFIRWAWNIFLGELIILISRKSRVDLHNEKNLWMYDRYSLTSLLIRSGFKQIQVLDFKTSQISGWARYNFDQSENGDYPLEPSVYVEGTK